MDELIQRQAGEIVQLRSEAMKCRVVYEQDAADWKARLSSLQEEHAAEVRLLERNLASVEEEHGLIVSDYLIKAQSHIIKFTSSDSRDS